MAVFEKMGDTTEFSDSLALINPIIEKYQKNQYQKIVVIYTHFISNLKQLPALVEVLPLGPENQNIPNLSKSTKSEEKYYEYLFEPDSKYLLEELIIQLVKIQIFQTILESNASEHAARMMAMRNATDNAKEIADDLEFTYNQLRQAKITREILEIASGPKTI